MEKAPHGLYWYLWVIYYVQAQIHDTKHQNPQKVILEKIMYDSQAKVECMCFQLFFLFLLALFPSIDFKQHSFVWKELWWVWFHFWNRIMYVCV
jgi:hypothetical protein